MVTEIYGAPDLSDEEYRAFKTTLFGSRHDPKAAAVDGALKRLYGGKPAKDVVSSAELKRAVRAELERQGISKKNMPSDDTMLRRAGYRK